MGKPRYRSSSGGSVSEMTTSGHNKSLQQSFNKEAVKAAHKVFGIWMGWRNHGKSFMHCITSNHDMGLAQSLMQRATQLDMASTEEKQNVLARLLLMRDVESGYTPLHWAMMERNLVVVLQIARHVAGAIDHMENGGSDPQYRLTQRPMNLLQGDVAKDLIVKVVQAKDHEGLTPLELLCQLQRWELAYCRQSLAANNVMPAGYSDPNRQVLADPDESLDNEFHLLQEPAEPTCHTHHFAHEYACEVLTFGRVNHCALGGGGGSSFDNHANSNAAPTHHQQQIRPQRVQAFALGDLGKDQSAVAVAAAAHHTLVATRDGRLFAFGLGKGGRLGTGDERHRPAPTRVMGPLARRKVVAIACAENHSLCVTSEGTVYAWGSNRFGQLGTTCNNTEDDSQQQRCLPRRVDNLKQVFCISVAAGDRHSVALSNQGEVYTWGDNQAGQLGITLRGGGSPVSGGGLQVNRVDALWGASPRRVAIAISAAAQSTLVLTCPPKSGAALPTNAVYSWGHGNHVPIKVNFSRSDAAVASDSSLMGRSHTNPVAIACAKYHNAAVTSDGRVFTWGLHAEPLGTTSGKKGSKRCSAGSMVIASPQVVTGMLPENGGGIAVAVSVCENHTAVLTDCGHLYTWGATYGKDVLGHQGVSWQPNPKKVPGVYRAVGVAAAKEHTVLLVGTSFPRLDENVGTEKPLSLETLAARILAKHVDLFNVIPILVVAERCNCAFLTNYCQQFIRLNLDGVLTLGRKSEMDRYLNDKLADGGYKLETNPRDESYHPLLFDIVDSSETQKWKSCGDDSEFHIWMESCKGLLDRLPLSLLARHRATLGKSSKETFERSRRDRALSFNGDNDVDSSNQDGDCGSSKQRSFRGCSERCMMLTANMSLRSADAARAKHDCLSKEVRSVRKRLNQISRLQRASDDSSKPASLTPEQNEKLARRPLLEADLDTLERAMVLVEEKMQLMRVSMTQPKQESRTAEAIMDGKVVAEEKKMPPEAPLEKNISEPADDEVPPSSFRCDICQVNCPDANSFAFHKNGRKHRNRVIQAEEKERKATAASMMETKRRQLLMDEASQHRQATPQPPALSAWQKKSPSLSVQPKYVLPPPPTYPSPEAKGLPGPTLMDGEKQKPWSSPLLPPRKVAESNRTSSFRGILQEEARRGPRKGQGPKPSVNPQSSPVACARLPGASPGTPPTFSLGVASSDVTPVTDISAKKTYSLGDFWSSSPSSSTEKPAAAPWSASPPASRSVTRVTPSACHAKSFLEIQQEEQELRTRQDQSCGMDGHWYIQRRERAGSISKIQQEEAQERERQLFVEEQKRIEEEIMREKEESTKKQLRKSRQRPAKQKKNNRSNKPTKENTSKDDTHSQGPQGGKKRARRRNKGKPKSRTASCNDDKAVATTS